MNKDLIKNHNTTNFKDLKFFNIEDLNGVQAIVKFDNGFGASIVKHNFSYGGSEGLYEMAVLDENNDICYSTSITNDVIGYLNEEEVSDYLNKIKNLI